MNADAGFAAIKARLDALGFRPSKRRGQNFLLDPNLCRAIATTLDLDRSDLVLEVGAGTGNLTRELARAARVIAVEIDARLLEFLEAEIAGWGELASGVQLVGADVLAGGRLAPQVRDAVVATAGAAGYVCVSNLPYSVAGPFLAVMAGETLPPRDGVVLTQWEVGARLVAQPGSRDYGSLGVLAQTAWAPAVLRRVPPDVFRPRPRVESALVSLGPAQPWLARPAAERRGFARFLQAVFGARRKVMRNALARAFDRTPESVVGAAGLPASWLRERPDRLAPHELLALFEAGRAS